MSPTLLERGRLWVIAVLASVLASACTSPEASAPPTPPTLESQAVDANPNNVLSATVVVSASLADSARVQYRSADESAYDTTDAVSVTPGTTTIPVLGLHPNTRYIMVPVISGPGGSVSGSPLEFTTGSLPADLPTFGTTGTEVPSGYTVLAAGNYGLVLDGTGRVVWYRHFADGPGLNFMAEPTGTYATRPTTVDVSDIEPWVELDPLGNVLRTLSCAGGLAPRFHDLILEDDGSYWMMCDETRTMDLSSVGGVATAQVTGTVIQHMRRDGSLQLQWSAFDHFAITDLPQSDRAGATVNWTHGNAMALEGADGLVVSFRSLSEITRISRSTGEVTWRMGGLANQFTFDGAGATPFAGQHGVRVLAPDTLLLLDNRGNPSFSRGQKLAFDGAARTAHVVAEFTPSPAVIGLLGGSAQQLPGGDVLMSYGSGRLVEQFRGGSIVWRLGGDAGYVFRAQRIKSLYHPAPE